MKKGIIFAALAGLMLMGCEPYQPNCSCGFITDDGIDTQNGNFYYWIEIRNDCSGNIGKFYLTQGDWYNAHPGSNFCFTNVSGWKTDIPNNLIPVADSVYLKLRSEGE